MAHAIAGIERDIQELPAHKRAMLFRSLIALLDASTEAEADVERAPLEESERRLAEIENGTAKTVPGREVLDEDAFTPEMQFDFHVAQAHYRGQT